MKGDPLYAEVILSVPLDKSFDYLVSEDLAGTIAVGQGVRADLGGRKVVNGIVKRLYRSEHEIDGIKPLTGILDERPVANKLQMRLCDWMSEYYLCPIGEVYHCATAAGFKCLEMGIPAKDSKAISGDIPHISFSTAQSEAILKVKESFRNKKPALLHGVTSSGKTEIYIHLISETLKAGKQVLFMLPEISITSQMTGRLKSMFSDGVRTYHSRLKGSQKAELWHTMVSNDSPILVLGVRSSVFLPFSNLGLVIVDEEHDPSYKQSEVAPRYNARDVAVVLAKLHGADIVLGSATPSIESLYNCESGKYIHVPLTKRFGNTPLPRIKVLDMLKARKQRALSNPLFHPDTLAAISSALENSEQVLIYQNRRGFSGYLQCEHCGDIPKCRNCDVSLAYHKESGKLMCHYCGFSIRAPKVCPSCNGGNLLPGGFGTERIEEELRNLFPEARLQRVDTDVIRSAKDWKELIERIENGDVDILIGTQMVSKGLDFGNIILTVVPSVEMMMVTGNFKAAERCFQSIIQVGGRCGRRSRQGTVLLQAYPSSNELLKCISSYDQLRMYALETAERKEYLYPPYCRFVKIVMHHADCQKCEEFASSLTTYLSPRFKNILGPGIPPIEKLRGQYYREILIKLKSDSTLAAKKRELRRMVSDFRKDYGLSTLVLSFDVDP